MSSCTVQVHLEQLCILSQRSGRVRWSHKRALGEGAPSERAEERAVVRVRLVFAHRANFILVGGRSGTVGQSVARRGRGEREMAPARVRPGSVPADVQTWRAKMTPLCQYKGQSGWLGSKRPGLFVHLTVGQPGNPYVRISLSLSLSLMSGPLRPLGPLGTARARHWTLSWGLRMSSNGIPPPLRTPVCARRPVPDNTPLRQLRASAAAAGDGLRRDGAELRGRS